MFKIYIENIYIKQKQQKKMCIVKTKINYIINKVIKLYKKQKISFK